MYVVFQDGGKQYRVSEGDEVLLELRHAQPGERIELDRVLIFSSENEVRVGNPILPDARVVAEVLGQEAGPKVFAFKYRRRKGFHRKVGHRQKYTRVRIREIITAASKEPVGENQQTPEAATSESLPSSQTSSTEPSKET